MHEAPFPFSPAAVTGPSIALFRCPCAIYYWNWAEPGNKIPFLFPTVFLWVRTQPQRPAASVQQQHLLWARNEVCFMAIWVCGCGVPSHAAVHCLANTEVIDPRDHHVHRKKKSCIRHVFQIKSFRTAQVKLCEPNWKFSILLEAIRFQLIPDV